MRKNSKVSENQSTTIRPATWIDFEQVMGTKGGCGGCWCMLWRQQRKSMEAQMGAANRLVMKAIFDAGEVPGLIAYDDKIPVAWCQVAPRRDFPRLATSRILKPLDDQEVWSVTCFLVRKTHRRQGISVALLQAAADHVAARGGRIIEGYPIEPRKTPYPAVYAWTGLASAFRKAGFVEQLRRSDTRPIMRRHLT